MSGHLAGLPAQVREAAEGSVAGAAAAAQHLPAPAGDALLRRAYDSYSSGMAEVMLVCAGVALAGALLVVLFLPARAADTRSRRQAPDDAASPQTAA